jgi:hypothetical protein
MVAAAGLGRQAVFAQEQEELTPLELNGTQWEITIAPISEKKEKAREATLQFETKNFSAQGFGSDYEPTNYTLGIREDGTTTFQTMQTKAKETTIWQGEVQGNMIQGTVGVNPSKGNVKNYVFAGKLTGGVLKPKMEDAPSEIPADAGNQAAPEAVQ